VEPAGPTLDAKMIAQLRELEEGNPGFLADLIELFFRETAVRLADLSRQVAARDTAAVQRTAHTLKGSCGNLGASGMQEWCRQLESAARDSKWEVIGPLATRVDEEFSRVRPALEAEKRVKPS
jgi:HPt (histidine-containing phosphotransfer) domain-containing protein